MARRFYNLPPLTMLAVFEAAARHVSFKFAAAELNVTPGAVSRQIKQLELELGSPLFTRVHRGVELTPEAEDLYAVLSRSFGQTAQVMDRIRSRNMETHVTIATTTAFATLWLMPRLGKFWREYPDIMLNHIISDNENDLRRPDVDLRVRYGTGAWSEDDSVFLSDDRIFPVCSAEFANSHGGLEAEALPDLPLLLLEGVDAGWTTWEQWLALAGIHHGPLRGRRFNNYAVILQAAQDGQGVALGWEQQVTPLLRSGKLQRLTEIEIKAPGSFYVTWNAARGLSAPSQTLMNWLVEEAGPAQFS